MPCLIPFTQRVVVLKDEQNKKAHSSSAQLACEAAASIRTVASLTREDDCCKIYADSLEEPLCRSTRAAFWGNLIFALSQAMTFFVIALVFWYGSRLVAALEISTFHFFIALMVRQISLMFYLSHMTDRITLCLLEHHVRYHSSRGLLFICSRYFFCQERRWRHNQVT